MKTEELFERIFKALESKYNDDNRFEDNIKFKLEEAVLDSKSEYELKAILEKFSLK
ncbi:hypothetical protein [Geovibrio thiophilus]|uniref:hypothetical protein n=1 Tax=Geovibrio thiophilus TaxID=139438 RepID=UPI0013E29451|nr:hypothetical protein [Geovibrio thiophilus]